MRNVFAMTRSKGVLPAQFYQKTLADLARGESAWAVPWSTRVAPDGRMYLNTSFSAHPDPGGTVSMRVTHTAAGRWVIDISRCDYAWARPEADGGYRKPTEVPVDEIVTAAEEDLPWAEEIGEGG